nr:NUDIX domain protein [uncultured bacterium]
MPNEHTVFSKDKIQDRVNQLAEEIAKDFENKKILLVCVLNGAYMFASDLSKALWNAGNKEFEIDFVRISSYGVERKSSGQPRLTKDIEMDLEGKDVIIVEDIIETGYTLQFLVEHLKGFKPTSIKICALLSKPLRKVPLEADYLGFEVGANDWVEGYGLDTAGNGRGRDDIIKR